MQGLATLTVLMYALAFFIVVGALAVWWVRRPQKNTTPGEPPPRYVDDSKDRIA